MGISRIFTHTNFWQHSQAPECRRRFVYALLGPIVLNPGLSLQGLGWNRVMNLSQLLCNLWHVASSLSLPLLERARRGVDDALRLDLWNDVSPTIAGIHGLTANVQTINIQHRIWVWHMKKVSILPATALTQPNSRGQNSNANHIRALEFLNANHGSQVKHWYDLAHEKWSFTVKLTTLEVTLLGEIGFQTNVMKLETHVTLQCQLIDADGARL